MTNFYKVEIPFKHDELGNIVFVAANDLQKAINILQRIGIDTHEIKSIEFVGQGYSQNSDSKKPIKA